MIMKKILDVVRVKKIKKKSKNKSVKNNENIINNDIYKEDDDF